MENTLRSDSYCIEVELNEDERGIKVPPMKDGMKVYGTVSFSLC